VALVVEHFYGNPEKYGIDKNKLGIEGASGGGYIVSGVGMIMA